MDVSVLHKHGQGLSRLLTRPSLVGDRLLDRARSTTFAMLGLTTAVGLGLVAFVLHQGWPSVFGGPIPDFSSERSHQGARSAAQPVSNGAARARRAGAVAPTPPGRGGAVTAGSRLSGSQEIAGPSPASPGPAGAEPPGEGASGSQPAAQTPAATPASAANPASTGASPPFKPAAGAGSSGDKGKGSSRSEGQEGRDSSPAPRSKSSSGKPGTSATTTKPSTTGPAAGPGKDDSAASTAVGGGPGNAPASGHYK